jgi:hypothetical protein
MTYKEIADVIASIGLPYAYYEFPDETQLEPPFICFYYPESDDLYADNKNYAAIRRLYVELYTDNKDFDREAAVENVLTANGFSFRKSELYINSERMWQITYQTEVVIS